MKGFVSGQNFNTLKVDVPVLRRDLRGTKVGLSAWNRAHKENIRAALVLGRGASAIRENPVWNSSRDVSRD
eukprot:276445-Pelagomonas_calceolata.AAC.1